MIYYIVESRIVFFFFFQAEDGIRDIGVTGVQTCALPILIESQWNRRSTLRIGHQERPCLVYSVTPLGNIVTVQSTVCLNSGVLLDQLTLASHALLTVLPRVIKIGKIDANAQSGGGGTHSHGLPKLLHLLLSYSRIEVSQHHEEDDKQVIIGHLHMVGMYFKSRENSSDDKSGYQLASESQHDACYHRWQIGQRHYFPYMSGRYNNKEIAGESPYHGAQNSQGLPEIESSQKYIEAQQIGEKVPNILRQPQVIGFLGMREDATALI